MAGHSTTTCVITSRIPIADVARLHDAAEQRGSSVSALIAKLVHDASPNLAEPAHGGAGTPKSRRQGP